MSIRLIPETLALVAKNDFKSIAEITIDGDNYDEVDDIMKTAFAMEEHQFRVTIDLRELEMSELSQAWPFVNNAIEKFAPRIKPSQHTMRIYAIMNNTVDSKEKLKDKVTNYLISKGVTCSLDVITDWSEDSQ
jgi:hypothetical protein